MPTPRSPGDFADWSSLHPTTQGWARLRILAGLCPADGSILRGEDTTNGLCPRCGWVWRYDVYAHAGVAIAPPE